jgi:hypothetical protein
MGGALNRLALLGWILTAAPAAAQEPDPTDAAVNRAVAYLISQQQKSGAIHEGGRTDNATAMTALAIMAMAAVGHQPTDETPEGQAMHMALEFVLRPDRQDATGYYGREDGSRMYGHGITTLMLAEMLGMGVDEKQDKLLRERLGKAIGLIQKSQALRKSPRDQGGWRYEPGSKDADLSVTVWQVMSLRSAKNAGLEVPGEMIESAVGYIRRCYQSARDADGKPQNLKSACGYEPGSAPTYTMGSAGLLSLQVCGQYDAPEVLGSADWLKDRSLNYGDHWFFYGTYYYAQGMYQRGGPHAAHARQAVADVLLKNQSKDGSWLAGSGQERSAGRIYATSLATLALAVKFHYLPIYQR